MASIESMQLKATFAAHAKKATNKEDKQTTHIKQKIKRYNQYKTNKQTNATYNQFSTKKLYLIFLTAR